MRKDLLNILENIPEGETSKNLENIFELFTNFLSCNYEKMELLKFLDELSDKQWHSYHLIEESISGKIKKWLEKDISKFNADELELILCICVKLGINSLYQKIINSKNEFDSISKMVIDEFIEEVGNDVSDPYEK